MKLRSWHVFPERKVRNAFRGCGVKGKIEVSPCESNFALYRNLVGKLKMASVSNLIQRHAFLARKEVYNVNMYQHLYQT